MDERWPSLGEPPRLDQLLRAAGVDTWKTPLGRRHSCRCTASRRAETGTMRVFPWGNDFAVRCWGCGMVENSIGYLKRALGHRSYGELQRYFEDRSMFPAGVPDVLIGHLERRDRLLKMFERWRARLRFESSPTGAALMPFYRETRSFADQLGLGDHGLALPSEVESAAPGLKLPAELKGTTFVHVELLRSLLGQPVCVVVFKAGSFDRGVVQRSGLRIWIAPEEPAMLAAPRSIDFADIGKSMVLTFDPALAVELMDAVARRRAQDWSRPAEFDSGGDPQEKGIALGLLYEPEGRVDHVPYDRAAIVHRPGQIPREALALHNPARDIRLVEHDSEARFGGDPADFFDDGRGVGLVEGFGRDLLGRAGDDVREASMLLRDLSADRVIKPEAIRAVCRQMSKLRPERVGGEVLMSPSDAALVFEAEGHRYRLANHAFHRSSAGRPACQITNFCVKIVCDQLDGDGEIVAHLLRLTMDGAYADFELPARDFDSPRRLWSAICAVAAREGFPSYPTAGSNIDKSRLPMIVRGLQQPAPQIRVGGRLGFAAGGPEFNAPSYTVGSAGVVARSNLPSKALRVVGRIPPPAPDIADQRDRFGRWLSTLEGDQLSAAAPAFCGALWWLAGARSGMGSFLAVHDHEQFRLIAETLGLPIVQRGRPTRTDAGYPKAVGTPLRSREQLLAHGDVVLCLAARNHIADGSVAMLVHDPKETPSPPEIESGGWLPLFAHAVVSSESPVEAIERLIAACRLDAGVASVIREASSFVVPPGGYAASFIEACRQCGEAEEIESRGRRFLPVASIDSLARRGYAFRRGRVTAEFRRLTPLQQPYFLGRRKQHVWQLPRSLGGGRGDGRPVSLGPRPLEGRALAAYRIGVVHAHLEWSSHRQLAKELEGRPDLRPRYKAWLEPGVARRPRLTEHEVRAYRSGYSATALNCVARTMPLDYVAPFDASLVTGDLFLDVEHRLSALLRDGEDGRLEDDDVHFGRFLSSACLLDPGAGSPPPRPALGNPFLPMAVTIG